MLNFFFSFLLLILQRLNRTIASRHLYGHTDNEFQVIIWNNID